MNDQARWRPMLFSGPMVLALLAGRKTQTRRLVPDFMLRHIAALSDDNDQPELALSWGPHVDDARERRRSLRAAQWRLSYAEYPEEGSIPLGPLFGGPGDFLWVRETFTAAGGGDPGTPVYRANWREDAAARGLENIPDREPRWTSPIHMPRIHSRLTLLILAVRLERLQEITEADALAEGVERPASGFPVCSARDWFRALWDSLNARRAPWASNPWVLAIEFEVVRSASARAA